MLTVSEQVAQEIHQSLKNMGLAALSSDNTGSLIGQLRDVARRENCVRSVIGECAHRGENGEGRGRSRPLDTAHQAI